MKRVLHLATRVGVPIAAILAVLLWYGSQAAGGAQLIQVDPPYESVNPSGSPADITNHILYEHQQMQYWLGVALGEEPCTVDGPECNRDEDFTRIMESLIERCSKVNPGGLESLKTLYNTDKAGQALAGLKAGCGQLHAAKQNTGPIAENRAWTEAAHHARKALDR